MDEPRKADPKTFFLTVEKFKAANLKFLLTKPERYLLLVISKMYIEGGAKGMPKFARPHLGVDVKKIINSCTLLKLAVAENVEKENYSF